MAFYVRSSFIEDERVIFEIFVATPILKTNHLHISEGYLCNILMQSNIPGNEKEKKTLVLVSQMAFFCIIL
jgi:hypothetical protein